MWIRECVDVCRPLCVCAFFVGMLQISFVQNFAILSFRLQRGAVIAAGCAACEIAFL